MLWASKRLHNRRSWGRQRERGKPGPGRRAWGKPLRRRRRRRPKERRRRSESSKRLIDLTELEARFDFNFKLKRFSKIQLKSARNSPAC